eukprot:SAG31_NODE_3768_length_3901_cov_4.885750_4_plen_140_part_00
MGLWLRRQRRSARIYIFCAASWTTDRPGTARFLIFIIIHLIGCVLTSGTMSTSIDAAERVLEGQSRSQGAGQQLLPIQQQQLQQQQMLQQMLQQQACTGQAAMAIQRRNATFALPNSSVVGNSAELTLGHMFTARPRSS